jgi:hypothetical protein
MIVPLAKTRSRWRLARHVLTETVLLLGAGLLLGFGIWSLGFDHVT